MSTGEAPPAQTTLGRGAGEVTVRDAAPTQRGRSGIAAGVGAGVALVGAAVVWAVFLRQPAAGPAGTSGAAAVQRPPSAAQATPAPPPPALPRSIVVEVSGTPPGVVVKVDGEPVSLPLHIPRDGRGHKVVFNAPGYREEIRTIEGTEDQAVALSMQKEPEAKPPATATAAKASRRQRAEAGGGGGTRPAPAPVPAAPVTPPAPAGKRPRAITDI
jgi:hypothetical protein